MDHPHQVKSVAKATFVGVEKWTRIYQRNNKSSGLKNLRCFPYCAEVHQSRRFCGRPVSLQVDLEEVAVEPLNVVALERNQTLSSVEAWMELGPSDDNEVVTNIEPTVKVGRVYSRHELSKLSRDGVHVTNPLLKGAVVHKQNGSKSTIFEFNQRKRGWHYHFTANKHTSDINHCARAYLMLPASCFKPDLYCANDNKFLICVGVYTSPNFKIFCRRRQRHLMDLQKLPEPLREHIQQQNNKRKFDISIKEENNLKRQQQDAVNCITHPKPFTTCENDIHKQEMLPIASPSTPDELKIGYRDISHVALYEHVPPTVSPTNSPSFHESDTLFRYPKMLQPVAKKQTVDQSRDWNFKRTSMYSTESTDNLELGRSEECLPYLEFGTWHSGSYFASRRQPRWNYNQHVNDSRYNTRTDNNFCRSHQNREEVDWLDGSSASTAYNAEDMRITWTPLEHEACGVSGQVQF